MTNETEESLEKITDRLIARTKAIKAQRDLLAQACNALLGVFGDKEIRAHDDMDGHELESCALCLGRAALAAVSAERDETFPA